MFTGIIKDVGKVVSLNRRGRVFDLTIRSKLISPLVDVDDSVSVNGCCQTVVDVSKNQFVVNVVQSTIEKSNLGLLKVHSDCNLELALNINDRIDGHLVQGHVNCVGSVKKIVKLDDSYSVEIEYKDKKHRRLLVNEGSIAIDGVSVTIDKVSDDTLSFCASIIPHTWKNTTFKNYYVGSKVNLEFDIFAQYVNRILSLRNYEEKMEKNIFKFIKDKDIT